MSFSFQLSAVGWLEARVSAGGRQAVVTASYLSDALRLLLEAAGAAGEGASSVTCVWEEEPGQYVWTFRRLGDYVDLRIEGSPALQAGHRRASLDALIPVDELLSSIADGARDLLEKHGVEGYRELWQMHGFPVAALEQLEQQIDGF